MPQPDDIFAPATAPDPLASPAAPAAISPVAPAAPALPEMRAFDDVPATRKAVYDHVFNAASTLPELSNGRHSLSVTGVHWADKDQFTKADRKRAVLAGTTMGRRLRGTFVLKDATGREVDKKTVTLMKVPHLTDGGTFVHNGSEYAIKNQQRLKAGVFTRQKANGEIETHANVLDGGFAHKYFLDPAKGVFYVRSGQGQIPLRPLMQALGATDEEMEQSWGRDIHLANMAKPSGGALAKLTENFAKPMEGEEPAAAVRRAFEGMKVDGEVNRRTLGQPYTNLNKDAVLAITRKLLAVSRKEADPDDRDHLAYQKIMGPEDILSERIAKDRAGERRGLLFKASGRGNLGWLNAGVLQKQLDSALTESGLGQNLEEVNNSELLDKMTGITRMGEGGIPSMDAVPDEARSVQPSHAMFIDPIRTPESSRAGIDLYMASNARKGRDGNVYGRFVDPRTGQETWKSPQEIADTVIAFPESLNRPGKRVIGMKNGRVTWVPRNDVSLVMPHFEHAFSPLGNLIPIKSEMKGQRVAMGSRMTSQALSLVNPEAPLVQSAVPGTNGQKSYEEHYGEHMGAERAKQGGVVRAVSPDGIHVRYDDGSESVVELHNNLPYNRKSVFHQTPVVEPGQRFENGSLLARSNYTNEHGTTALGVNARVAYAPWAGANYEDAIAISESMAKRLSSVHMYQHQLELNDRTRTGRKAYVSLFPHKYDRQALEKMDDHGIVKVGQLVNHGDPLILGAEERAHAANKVHKPGQKGFNDVTVTWDHHDPGVVTDIVSYGDKGSPLVVVKSVHPMKLADKMSGRYGDKGVVSKIIPDHMMPHDEKGRPFEVLTNPLGILSRGNPSQYTEAALGKIAAERRGGQPYRVEDYDEKVTDRRGWADDLLKQHGLSSTETIVDPATGRRIPGVKTGNRFFMKLSHTSESKGGGRAGGGYDATGAPSRGGPQGSKRISLLDANAILSAGATGVLRDASVVRGQKNDQYWAQFMQGHTPTPPGEPLVYKKFLSELRASGIHVHQDGPRLRLMALTDKDVDHLAGDREIKNGETVNFDDALKPIQGGLFDESLTGGHHSGRWSAIRLHEPVPNPVMEEPIRRVLGLTRVKFDAVMSGEEKLGDKTGPSAIVHALKGIDVDQEIKLSRSEIENGTQAKKDAAVRRLDYLKSAQRLKMHPGDWTLSRAPVLPTQFRPVSLIGNKNVPLVSDPNYLYKELLETTSNLKKMEQTVGGENVGPERAAVYHALKAVTGLGDPLTKENQDRNVRGILKSLLGSSPKFGTVQRNLISSAVDNVGRAVILPNPDFDMDTVGIPEDRAFDVYQRYIVRRLKRAGMPAVEAMKHAREKTDLARKTLIEEMDSRPVIVNRAPVLHRFGIMALRPKLVQGSAMQLSPLIYKGYGADNDGDAMQYHVPADDDARREALDRMLPSRQLISPADFKTPVHAAGQEYLAGAYTASTAKSGRTRTFADAASAIRAWKNGELDVGDQVKIINH